MPSIRSALARRTLGATAASALLLTLAACGDDDDSSAGGDFCGRAESLENQFADADLTDQDTLAEVSSTLESIDPPSEVADDWEAMVNAYQAIVEVDMTDAEEVAALQEDPQFQNIDESIQNIETYLEDECGIQAE